MCKAQVISCIFGTEFQKVHPAFEGRRCTLLTNNEKLRAEVEGKGWNFLFVERHPLSSNSRISSIQSKYAKFLQFWSDFPQFSSAEPIFYADHKFKLDSAKLDALELKHKDSPFSMFLPSGWERNVSQEVDVASQFQRYNETMPQTRWWLQSLVDKNLCKMDADVKCTTFIYYKDPKKVQRLLDEVYRVTWDLAQPECQIIFGALYQQYANDVFSLTWNDIGGERKLPD